MANALRLLYVNANHCRAAITHLQRNAETDLRADIVAVTDPYTTADRLTGTERFSFPGWKTFLRGKSVICVNRQIPTFEIPTAIENTVIVRLSSLTLVVAYLPPSRDARAFYDAIAIDISRIDGPILFVGDLNSATNLVPGIRTTPRGELFEEFLIDARLNFWVPNAPTWIGPLTSGFNDVVLSKGITPTSTEVLSDVVTLSDHRYICLEWTSERLPPPRTKKLDKEALEQAVRDLRFEVPDLDTEEQIDAFIAEVTTTLQAALDTSTIETRSNQSFLRWWTPELDMLKHAVTRATRLEKRRRGVVEQLIARQVRISLTRKYRDAMKKAKEAAWREFISPRTPWGKPYNVLKKMSRCVNIPALKKADGTFCTSSAQNTALLLESKFGQTDPIPHVPPPPDSARGTHGPPPLITPEKVASHIRYLNNRKSPGPDRINHSLLKVFHRLHPHVLPAIYTACCTLGYFPRPWRNGRVVFIPKPGKDPTSPDSYRPITLLSALGKTFERVLLAEMQQALKETEALHRAQYGFMPSRSTEDAIHEALGRIDACRQRYSFTVLLSCDIKGAFDNADWNAILNSTPLQGITQYVWRILRSYLSDRTVQSDGQEFRLTRGCPQGSVLGPTLWNAIHDRVIREIAALVFAVICYADDTLLVIGANSRASVQRRAARAIRRLSALLLANGLELNNSKTEIMAFVDAHRMHMIYDPAVQPPVIDIPGARLEPKRQMKYLGVWLDDKLSFDYHIQQTIAKCRRILPMLTQLCQNTCGYSNAARRVMVYGALYTHLFYCSSVFYHRLWIRQHRKKICELQRLCDRMIIRGYRTISGDAASVIALSPPLDLLLVKRSLQYLLKTERPIWYYGAFPNTVNADLTRADWSRLIDAIWEERWALSSHGPWTHELFPRISVRRRTELRLDFWLTQALSGHGVFGAYLHRFHRRATAACPCGQSDETTKHVFAECHRFADTRPPHDAWTRPLRPVVVRYLEDVVIQLWRIENPGHRLNTA